MDAAVAGDLCQLLEIFASLFQPYRRSVCPPPSLSTPKKSMRETVTGQGKTRHFTAVLQVCILTLTALLVLLGHTEDNMQSLEVFRIIFIFLGAYSLQMQSRWMGASTSAILLGVLGDAPMLRHT